MAITGVQYQKGKCTVIPFKPLNASPTKRSNTLKQLVDNSRWIVWVFSTILWGWRLKGQVSRFFLRFHEVFFAQHFQNVSSEISVSVESSVDITGTDATYGTAWKLSAFGVFLVGIFLLSDIIRCISPYSVRFGENTNQKNSEYGQF